MQLMIANGLLVILNLVALALALLIGEYEVSKLQSPEASWLATPVLFDFIMVGVISAVCFFNLAILLFVIMRKLDEHRRWLWWTTGAGTLGVIILAVVLGDRFLPIVWPY